MDARRFAALVRADPVARRAAMTTLELSGGRSTDQMADDGPAYHTRCDACLADVSDDLTVYRYVLNLRVENGYTRIRVRLCARCLLIGMVGAMGLASSQVRQARGWPPEEAR